MESIFVSIICYRDTDVIKTVQNLLKEAIAPENINICVILQEKEEFLDRYDALKLIPNVNLQIYPIEWAEGCGKARAEAQKFYNGETYFFQTDSHMRFDPGWDKLLIDEIKVCPSDKPILTTLPPHFDQLTEAKHPPHYVELRIREFFRNLVIVAGHPVNKIPEQIKATPFLAGGVLFSIGAITKVKYDPYFYFHGEELSMNLRLWTHGFTNFLPRFNFCYHAYRTDEMERPLLMKDQPIRDSYLHERSMSRFQVLTGLKQYHEVPQNHLIQLEEFNLGNVRSIKDWEDNYRVWLKEQTADRALYL